jgi:RNA polymerase sigma-70 factor (ECF subfamily)
MTATIGEPMLDGVAGLATAHDELRDLAARAVSDGRAMTELVRRTGPPVRRLCTTLVDSASADDLAQETYLRMVRALSSYRGEASVLSWLSTIARRVCADEIGRRQRIRTLEQRMRGSRPRGSSDATALVDLCDALDRLSPPRRDAFLLTVVGGMPYAQAARLSRCPIGTIRSRVARARQDLIAALADEAAPPAEPALPALPPSVLTKE